MYAEKIRILEGEILEIKKAIKTSKKEIKKFTNELKIRKQLVKNYRKL